MVRRAVLLAAALGLSLGCPADPVPAGRYACSRDAGESEAQPQCPDNWRCGLEGYCHELGDSKVPWRCEVDDDCENGWHCGLAESRKQRECHDSERPFAHACETDLDCVLQWRCGLERVCHARGTEVAYLCRGDAGLDDRWCEKGWRCAADGLCANPTDDALRPFTPPAFPAGTTLNPAATLGPVEKFSVSQVYPSGLGSRLQTVAVVQDGGLFAWLIDRTGERPPARFALGDGPSTFAAHGSRSEEQLLDTTFRTEERTRVYFAVDAGVAAVQLDEDGGASRLTIPFFAPVSRFAQGSAGPGVAPRLLAYSSDPTGGFLAISSPTSRWGGFYGAWPSSSFDSVPGNRVLDLASIRPGGTEAEVVFATDARGLWMQAKVLNSNQCFLPLLLPPLSRPICQGPEPVTQKPTLLRPLGTTDLGVASEALDGTGDFLSVVDVGELWTSALGCNSIVFPCGQQALPARVAFGPCRACPIGRLLDFVLSEGMPKPRFELSCSGLDGGAAEHFSLTAGSGPVPICTRALRTGESSLFDTPAVLRPEQMAPAVVAYSDGRRNVWAGLNATSALPLALDRVPSAVVRRSGGQVLMLSRLATAYPEPEVGLFAQPGMGAVAGVGGNPSWALLEDGQVLSFASAGQAVLVARVGPLAALDPPYDAVHARNGAGSSTLVVTTGFGLLAGEVDAQKVGAEVGQVPLRYTAPAPLRSIAFPKVAPLTGYLDGYAVSGAELLRLTATTLHRWSDLAISTPRELLPLEVWYDVERARVGFDDGTVFSLPSRVEIAPPLPGGDEVVDYVQVCGQQLALGSRGLYRLEPVAGRSIGRWASLPLPEGFGASGFLRGGARGVGSELYVFTRGGDAARWKFDSCPFP